MATSGLAPHVTLSMYPCPAVPRSDHSLDELTVLRNDDGGQASQRVMPDAVTFMLRQHSTELALSCTAQI